MTSAFASAGSLRRPLWVVGAIGLGLSVLGFLVDRTNFFAAYLQAYLFVLAFPLGALGLLMIHNLTGGLWGWTLRPFLYAGVQTMPWMALFFVPVVLGMHTLYPWTNAELVHHDPALLAKAGYLNANFWIGRAVFYFACWIVLAFFLKRWLLPGTKVESYPALHRVQRLSAAGLIIYMLTASFAAIDWVMSIEPKWFSSLFGAILVVGQATTGFGFGTYVAILMHRRYPNPWVTHRNLHDLGKFLFMCVMLWGYLSVSQYLLIWMANLPEETFWYQMRYDGMWKWISTILALTAFFLPFFILLPSRVKKNADALMKIIPFMLCVRLLENIYLVAPSFRNAAMPLHWLDLATVLGLGGVYCALYFTSLAGSPGIPMPVLAPHGHGTEPQDKNVPRPKH